MSDIPAISDIFPRRSKKRKIDKCGNEEHTGSQYFNISDNQKIQGDDEPLDLTVNKYHPIPKLDFCFYNVACIDLAKKLLGKLIVRRLPTGEILRGRIVETESYLGSIDKASHSYNGKQTDRNMAMFMKPGTAYVYSIYGMYYCLNISSLGEGAAVLIRSLEPIHGLKTMNQFRIIRRSSEKPLKDKELCNGPSKLCQALSIEKTSLNKEDLTVSDSLWLEQADDVNACDVITSKRVGIGSAGEEWMNKPLRFYIRNNIFVSVRDKTAENLQLI